MDKNLIRPWYLNTWFIFLLGIFSFLIIPAPICIALIVKQHKHDKSFCSNLRRNIEKELDEKAKQIINTANIESEKIINNANAEAKQITESLQKTIQDKTNADEKLNTLVIEIEKLEKKEASLSKKVTNLQIAQKSITSSVKYYRQYGECEEFNTNILDLVYPTIILPTHSMDIKALRSRSKTIQKQIEKLLIEYDKRYTTKANKSIYSLMTIALQSELQNILYNLKYDKIDNAKDAIEKMTNKYLTIAGDGNKSIYGTLVKFIGEIQSHFMDLVDTEYEYYTKREREKEEQRALKEQMRQEAEERKQLEKERKKIEAEESKYSTEISTVNELIQNEKDDNKLKQLEERLKLLESQLAQVESKKEEIVSLQNGKAGYVYIISNIGSFGDEVFKVGMTRRLEPMDRIKELGGASVPFSFDIHSFIFSEDAPALENKLHKILDSNRVNKVNLRKEFFRVSIDDLENITNEIDPTAEFKRSILAQEYRQSQIMTEKISSTKVS
ncbi:MAG: GIY-YIG nuclease family protein [Anaeromicrobium sp.]|uniref:GIY-YIG nuclease family protein n=1 Tax=Anaeromicrobium sp. TaxID=1929132 RepID=UPI0025E1E3A6|nr:GIY-YIG nuclease family protein [Anaeromicrobium sp.]MCT4593136.1 GIY-YIG nuclease family protein [Anaeromicrobium sp.]